MSSQQSRIAQAGAPGTQSSEMMFPSVANVVNSLDQHTARVGELTFSTTAMTKKIPIYKRPEHATDKQIKCFLVHMTLCGRSTDDRPHAWQTWVLTWSLVLFPDLLTTLTNERSLIDHDVHDIPDDILVACEENVTRFHGSAPHEDQFMTLPSAFPIISTVPLNVDVCIACKDIEGIYAYYAMIVFVMGKSLSPENVSALASKRPDALMRKRKLFASEYILKGAGRIKSENYSNILAGWVRSDRPRITIVKYLAKLAAVGERSTVFDPIVINMDMLRNSGQTYIYHIQNLLVACDWVLEIPAIRAAFRSYALIVAELARQEDWFRPFYKMAMQDVSKTVRRRNIEALIGVATSFAAQTQKTMNKYRISEGVMNVVAEFNRLAREKGLNFAATEDQLYTETTAV